MLYKQDLITLVTDTPIMASQHNSNYEVLASSINNISGSQIADSSIDGSHIADNAITGAEVEYQSILSEHIQDNAVTTSKIVDYSIPSSKIAATVEIGNVLSGFSESTSRKPGGPYFQQRTGSNRDGTFSLPLSETMPAPPVVFIVPRQVRGSLYPYDTKLSYVYSSGVDNIEFRQYNQESSDYNYMPLDWIAFSAG